MPKGKIPVSLNESEARLKISSYCAYQERSPKQVLQKLQDYGLPVHLMESVLVWLQKENFVNENRFAETYVLGKFRLKKWGRNKVRQGLLRHNISPQRIEEALSKIDDEEYNSTLRELAEKKIALLKGTPEIQWIKLTRYLLGKGFESHLIIQLKGKI